MNSSPSSLQNKVLVICGPTATGKTDLGIYLAKKFAGEIISADSRQVYKNMTVGTGKEYSDEVPIWGYDLVSPLDDFSLSHFQKFAHSKIVEIWNRKKLPIIVGGTGLYIRAILENIETAHVPPNEALRDKLQSSSVGELFNQLYSLNKDRALLLNDSDKKNPRRLIRAIEVAMSVPKPQTDVVRYNTLIIGLKSNITYLENRLMVSIKKRMQNGMVAETQKLISDGVSLSAKALTATGYVEIINYLQKKTTKEEALDKWFLAERQYVKRQLTWFNKIPEVMWFDISLPKYKEEVEEIVKKWDNIPCLEK